MLAHDVCLRELSYDACPWKLGVPLILIAEQCLWELAHDARPRELTHDARPWKLAWSAFDPPHRPNASLMPHLHDLHSSNQQCLWELAHDARPRELTHDARPWKLAWSAFDPPHRPNASLMPHLHDLHSSNRLGS
ncbi:unnamed protein product [Ilex paraguariensis]|uniref:Uncharacterized protein n=1 Tax=Ilex paraguariensis TaxID=185542 RepID=A0ABC8TLV9_9AQUA